MSAERRIIGLSFDFDESDPAALRETLIRVIDRTKAKRTAVASIMDALDAELWALDDALNIYKSKLSEVEKKLGVHQNE